MAVTETRRILVVQLARFGDLIQSAPLFSALKREGSRVELSVLTDKSQADLAGDNPDIDVVLAADPGKLEGIAGSNSAGFDEKIEDLHRHLGFLSELSFDRIINLNTSRTAALMAELPTRGFLEGPRLGEDRSTLLFPKWADVVMNLIRRRRLIRFNLVDLWRGYAGKVAGKEKTGFDGFKKGLSLGERIIPDSFRRRPLIGIQMGSRHIKRRRPVSFFAKLAESTIGKMGAGVVLFGSKAEIGLGESMMAALSGSGRNVSDSVLNLIGKTSVFQLASALDQIDLLTTTDTGTMHLAAAVGTPTVSLFLGPALCHETGPYGDGHLIIQTMMDCSPCSETKTICPEVRCGDRITPDLAYRAVEWMLNKQIGRLPTSDEMPIGVRMMISELDEFGVNYRPLIPWPLQKEDIMAMAYREAGRGYMRPEYCINEEALKAELNHYLPGDDLAMRNIDFILGASGRLDVAVSAYESDSEPDLAPLSHIIQSIKKRGRNLEAAKFRRDMRLVLKIAAGRLADVDLGLKTMQHNQ